MKASKLMVGMLALLAVSMPLVSQAGKPYQRFDTNAVYENKIYHPGEKICVMKRQVPDGEKTPWVQFKVVGHNDLNVDKYQACDTDAINHMPEQSLSSQIHWETTRGRKLYSTMVDDIRFNYSPGSVICKNYNMVKIDQNGKMQGTGRDCGFVDVPTFDPR